MEFSENQQRKIDDFVFKYNFDDEFKSFIQNLYDNDICKLSILNIYALEEVIGYGKENIFREFLEKKGEYSLEEAINLYDDFITLIKEYHYFKKHKERQFTYFKDTLSKIEIFIFELINKYKNKKLEQSDNINENLEYDELNPILYDTDSQIKDTLKNLLFGEVIYEILENPSMKLIKSRQKEDGRIANIDKLLIIGRIRSIISDEDMNRFNQIINSRYIRVKHALLLGRGEEVFNEYLKYNTNISSIEIIDESKHYDKEKIYKKFMETLINK